MDTGQRRTWGILTFVYMFGMIGIMTPGTGFLAYLAWTESAPFLWWVTGFSAVYLAGFVWFTFRQLAHFRRGNVLLAGPTTEMLRGRIIYLELELFAWVGRPPLFAMAVANVGAVCFVAWVIYLGVFPLGLTILVAWCAFMTVLCVFGAHRVKVLRREMAETQALLATLEIELPTESEPV
ncbi:MAG: hypothetical protein HN348_36850 [Proteobacteria bacterium]|jgi:hypothetical protein|nr:hypothetical protein [Pseudomonadota bacterium]